MAGLPALGRRQEPPWPCAWPSLMPIDTARGEGLCLTLDTRWLSTLPSRAGESMLWGASARRIHGVCVAPMPTASDHGNAAGGQTFGPRVSLGVSSKKRPGFLDFVPGLMYITADYTRCCPLPGRRVGGPLRLCCQGPRPVGRLVFSPGHVGHWNGWTDGSSKDGPSDVPRGTRMSHLVRRTRAVSPAFRPKSRCAPCLCQSHLPQRGRLPAVPSLVPDERMPCSDSSAESS